MNIPNMLTRLGGRTYNLTCSTGGGYSPATGEYAPAAEVVSTIFGLVHPLTTEDIISIPEGDRTRKRVAFYCVPELLLADEDTGAIADRIAIDGEDFSVEAVQRYNIRQNVYTRAVLVRFNQAPDEEEPDEEDA